jgi:hypothetical protein
MTTTKDWEMFRIRKELIAKLRELSKRDAVNMQEVLKEALRRYEQR